MDPQRDPRDDGRTPASGERGGRPDCRARPVLAALDPGGAAPGRSRGAAGRGAEAAPARALRGAARVHLHHGPLPDPPVPALPGHRHPGGPGAHRRGGPAADPGPLPAHQAAVHHDPGALPLPHARGAVQGPSDDRADRDGVHVPVAHPAARAGRAQGGRDQPLPGEPAHLPGGGRHQRDGGDLPGGGAARHQRQGRGGGPGEDPRPAAAAPAAPDPDLVPLL